MTLAFLPAQLLAVAAAAASDAALHASLEVLSQKTVFFGHQSVGKNIVDGLAELAKQEGVPLRIVEVERAPERGSPPCFAHAYVGENGKPELKLQGFGRALADVDIALVKFCFVDLYAGVDPAALFEKYQAAMRELSSRHPSTTFVHVTVPLTSHPGRLRELISKVRGRETAAAQNFRREQYNELMRAAYEGREPLFDLARIESIGPDGAAQSVEWRGRQTRVLASPYTDDGGHLSAAGRARVARELVLTLAAVADRRGAGGR